MPNEHERLQMLKAKMTKNQQQEMAELLAAELERRKQNKHRAVAAKAAQKHSSVASAHISGNGDGEVLNELYENVDDKVKGLRLKHLDKQLRDIRSMKGKNQPLKSKLSSGLGQVQKAIPALNKNLFASLRKFGLIFGIVTFGALKILLSSGIVNASSTSPTVPFSSPGSSPNAEIEKIAEKDRPESAVNNVQDSGQETDERSAGLIHQNAKQAGDSEAMTSPVSLRRQTLSTPQHWSSIEKELLTQLDARRVELEKRREMLDKREGELNNLARSVSEKLLDVQSITKKLSEMRKEKDQAYEARLTQLSEVYGSMGPKEAAPLIGKLDTEIAISLLQRLPGKKLAAILGVMDSQRAVELTKGLSAHSAP